MTYAELHCHSYFSFLDGASSPEELVARAADLGLEALALTDHDGLYGAVAFYRAATKADIKPIIGAEVTLTDASHLTLLAKNRHGYGNLCRLLSYAHRDQPKGTAALAKDLLAEHSQGLICLSGCARGAAAQLLLHGDTDGARRALVEMASWFAPGDFAVEIQRQWGRKDAYLSLGLIALADELDLPVVATGNVHYARREQSRLQDVLVCIKHNVTLAEANNLLRPNSEFFLRSPEEMARLFADRPDALDYAAAIAERCELSMDFSADAIPAFPLPPGESADGYLRRLCEEALPIRHPENSAAAREQMEHELRVIRQTGLAEYFLTVHDIVTFAREQGIRCQGRGSAANSIVAHLLGITAVDPLQHNLLFERFLSVERYCKERAIPDIDLDFERDRREEVIQYLYRRYGWEHTAMVCTLVTFRARSAIRDVGKALGFAPEALARVSQGLDVRRASELDAEALADTIGEDAYSEKWRTLCELCHQIDGIPRHLGIHVGGMIVTRCPLLEVVPLEPATMPGRVVVQWDKDSVEDAGLIKIDLLSLAMLSAIGESAALIEEETGAKVDLSALSPDDPAVYDMICGGDTIGVFQVESRAQAQMLPRLKPRSFNDLVIEIALVRPGPLQGGMVHPYLRRRSGQEPVSYQHPAMAKSLADTLGIIIFQEQVLMVARDVAGFSPGEAELLRRAMGRKRSREEMESLRERFVQGAVQNGASKEQAQQIYNQLAAFSGFGFNRAHAASFALLTYASAWLKRYYPLQFFTALLNNQPMGFYSPSVVVEDAKRHGIRLLPPDVNLSGERCRIEDKAIRLGLNYVRGLGPKACRTIVLARAAGPFSDLSDLCRRAPLHREAIEALILSGALDGWGVSRRRLLWNLNRAIQATEKRSPLLVDDLPNVPLPPLSASESLALEYAHTGVSSGGSPASLFHKALQRARALPSVHLADADPGVWVRVGGQVIVRQRPPTAKGFVFVTLQDDCGHVNLVLRPTIYQEHRLDVRAPGLLAEGVVEREAAVVNVIVERLWPLFPEV